MSSDAAITSRSLLVTRESRVPTAVALLVTVVMLTVTMVDFVGDLQATDTFTSETPEWALTFEVQTYTMQAVETLQDDETRVLEFDMAEVTVPEGYAVGSINVTITSEEEEGISVQCDSVAGDLIENGLTAQWNSPMSNLSGQDSSCQPIDLALQVYPDFDGRSATISASNEYQAMQHWLQDGWGDGVLLVELDLDVNSPLGIDPIGQDTDEEITVDVTVVMFKANISLIA